MSTAESARPAVSRCAASWGVVAGERLAITRVVAEAMSGDAWRQCRSWRAILSVQRVLPLFLLAIYAIADNR